MIFAVPEQKQQLDDWCSKQIEEPVHDSSTDEVLSEVDEGTEDDQIEEVNI